MKVKVEITRTAPWSRRVESYVVEHHSLDEVKALIRDAVDDLKARNEDRASYDYTVVEYEEPQVIDFGDLKDWVEADLGFGCPP